MQITKALRLAFENKQVQIILKNVYAYIIEQDTNGALQKQGAAAVEGFFIDYDDVFLYLGNEAGEIQQAIAIENIASIALSDEDNKIKEVLEFLSFPTNDNEVN